MAIDVEPWKWSPADIRTWLSHPDQDATAHSPNWWLGLVEALSLHVDVTDESSAPERLDWLVTACAVLDHAFDLGAMSRLEAAGRRLALSATALMRIPGDDYPPEFAPDAVVRRFLDAVPYPVREAAEFAARWNGGQQEAMWRDERDELIQLRQVKGWLLVVVTLAEEIRSAELRSEIARWLELRPRLP
jgi:hypothetical protein